MMITNEITMDLQLPGTSAIVHTVQDDCFTRQPKISLTDSGTDRTIPEDVSLLAHFSRPDGSGGQSRDHNLCGRGDPGEVNGK